LGHEVTARALANYVTQYWEEQQGEDAKELQRPTTFAITGGTEVPLVTIVRTARQDDPADEPLGPPSAGPVIGPHGDVRIDRDGNELRLAWILQPTGERRPWPVPVVMRPAERALAVTSLYDRSAAYILLSGAGHTRIVRAEPDGTGASLIIPDIGESSSGGFGIGRDVGTVVLALPDGTTRRHDIAHLINETHQ
jgi:hypothetical protein